MVKNWLKTKNPDYGIYLKAISFTEAKITTVAMVIAAAMEKVTIVAIINFAAGN